MKVRLVAASSAALALIIASWYSYDRHTSTPLAVAIVAVVCVGLVLRTWLWPRLPVFLRQPGVDGTGPG